MADEARYKEVTITLMLNVAKMDAFPDLAKHEDAGRLIAQAQAAVAEVGRWTERHQEILEARAAYARDIASEAEAATGRAQEAGHSVGGSASQPHSHCPLAKRRGRPTRRRPALRRPALDLARRHVAGCWWSLLRWLESGN
jgi:hypothetical protein